MFLQVSMLQTQTHILKEEKNTGAVETKWENLRFKVHVVFKEQ